MGFSVSFIEKFIGWSGVENNWNTRVTREAS